MVNGVTVLRLNVLNLLKIQKVILVQEYFVLLIKQRLPQYLMIMSRVKELNIEASVLKYKSISIIASQLN
jgi:hypothetical protein